MAEQNGTCHDAAPDQTRMATDDDTWVLQGDAAASTGFSVSAIRKWRRMGVVADRKMSGPGGVERVEVRLEDVLARAALQPERQRTDPGAGGPLPPAGSALVSFEDLEAIFERMVEAEWRARHAEAEVERLRGQETYISGQLAELRRQIAADAGRRANWEPPAPVVEPPQRPPDEDRHEPNVVAMLAPRIVNGAPARIAPAPAPAPPSRRVSTDGGSSGVIGSFRPDEPGPPEDAPPQVARELREAYGRLDEYRRKAVLTPADEQNRLRDLAVYDRELLGVCAALGIATGVADGEPVSVEARGALTRALAAAGIDVREGIGPSGDGRSRPVRFRRRA